MTSKYNQQQLNFSSLSSSLNALSAMIYGDFVLPLFPEDVVKQKEYFILRAIVVICGTVSTIAALFLDKMGAILPFSNASVGALFGLLFGLYSLGILFPAANAKGAFCGTVISFLVTAVIASMNQWYSLNGSIASSSKSFSVEGCTIPVNITRPLPSEPSPQPFVLFRLSFFYNAVISAATVVLVGIGVSYFTKTEKCVHPDLISPISLRFVRKYCPNGTSAQYVVGKDGGRDTFSFEGSM
uniref:Sodium-coupled monocarboxylate transporter 2 n=1 Tax=Photinus pyralis TaxID=7054 RepID=A0A1Y1N7Q4_PHOPY